MNNTALALLPLALAYIMFTLGAGLKLSDFKVIAKYPKAFFVGLINQVVLVPLVALAVVLVTAPPPAIAFGIMLISFCPGGVTSNMLTYYAKGNVALSIALTGVVSILSVITLPILITLAFDHFMKDQANSISAIKIGLVMFLLTTLPVSLGMLARHRFTDFMVRRSSLLNGLASIFFVLIVFAAIASNWQLLQSQFTQIGLELIFIIAILFAISILISKVLKLSWFDTKTISIETSIQNSTTAITLAPIIMGVSTLPVIALPAALYGVLPVIFLIKNKN
ncbi:MULTISPECIES: bile acid:sodium symporter family protein [Psychrobacter]|jgi:BASS family bile acid:Na+ symporter|uniref:bile acid:sodium symporter family protein n=1 Tax=Psychrobacter TaxID=497 RepID=UPI000C34716C|nr:MULTISPECIES: bile acid:sodium symporter family protein [Psychrobacter]MBA6244680.1 bile acid:sodium symporter family protein [Psychrobacter sp. Urea-trap-18]MBA6285843.1 bile acid:sodium symporter family protein [Psychrobacter sp. Urea-trap-16]MBA6318685.1 bile acid:sodium symporter family protein [Psychrobacter sp. Urea-trap-20]MBA6334928.1 bile acid:sodium symporter family protein [Psychrobacter sp. Urea-trap-19]PKG60039.1 bile acid:sodium symporter [Psychrobacter sp. Choline-3u-12]